MTYVVVTGPPASGKSTLAAALARALDLPLLTKDTIKQGLVEALGADDVEASRRLGRAAVAALLRVAADCRAAVLDSVWVDREGAVERLDALGEVVEVHLDVDVATLRERYAARAAAGDRAAYRRFDEERDEAELWSDERRAPLAGPWPVIEVAAHDPDDPGEVAELAGMVRLLSRRTTVVRAATEADTRELWPAYAEVFADRPDEATWRAEVWDRHAAREGFRLVRVRELGRLVGFGYGYTGRAGQWWTDQVARALDPRVAEEWLGGHFELVSLGVRAAARGRGVGAEALDALTAGLPQRRWLLSATADETDPARRLYASRGWRVLGPGIAPGTVVLGREGWGSRDG